MNRKLTATLMKSDIASSIPRSVVTAILVIATGGWFPGTISPRIQADSSSPVQEHPEIQQLYEESITVVHRNRREFHGAPTSFTTQSLSVTSIDGAVTYTFPREDIQEIRLPGRELLQRAGERIGIGDDSAALDLMEGLLHYDLRFFPFLSEETIRQYLPLLEGRLRQNRPLEAIVFAELLLPHLQHEPTQHQVEDLILRAMLSHGFLDEMESRLEAWFVRASTYDQDALGWWVQALIHLRRDEPEQALHRVLEPIVFSSQLPMRDLEHCYAVAIHAAMLLEDSAYATTLLQEMEFRHLTWPDPPWFPELQPITIPEPPTPPNPQPEEEF